MILRSVGLMAGLSVVKGVSTLLLSLAVARTVQPAEFGAVSFSIPLMVLLTLLTDLGLASAIVREKSLTRLQASACVTLSLVLGVASGCGMALLASSVERVSGIHGLTPILTGFGLVTALQVAATSPRALLERRLAYSTVAKVEFHSLLLALAAFSIVHFIGLGAMEIVVFHAALQAGRALGFFVTAASDFEHRFTLHGIAQLLKGLGWVVAANLLNYSARNVDRFIIGGLLGAAALGLYGMAYQFMIIPLMILAWPASGVLLPALSRGGLGSTDQSDVLMGFILLTAVVVFPLMTYIGMASRVPLQVLLSPEWGSLASLIAILAPVGCIQSIAAYTGAVLISKGALRLNFLLSALNGLCIPIVIALASSHGLKFAVAAYAISASIVATVMIFQMARNAGISAKECCVALAPGVSVASISATLAGLLGGGRQDSVASWLSFSAFYLAGLTISYYSFRRVIGHAVAKLLVARAAQKDPLVGAT